MSPTTALSDFAHAMRECGYDGPFEVRLPRVQADELGRRVHTSFPVSYPSGRPATWSPDVVFEFHGIRISAAD